MKIFNIINENDPNDSFEIEAKNETDAAIDALEVLGWRVCVTTNQKSDPNQSEFDF
jgi:hypothetical protein